MTQRTRDREDRRHETEDKRQRDKRHKIEDNRQRRQEI